MQDTGAALDDRMRAALARLTENEKDCLRRRLRPQTAKEMALELNISPHAVEKRLKMARAKLGVSSSIEAARLLTLSENEYQPRVPQPPDLSASATPLQSSPHRAETPPSGRRSRRGMTAIWGATMSSLFLAAAFTLGMTAASQEVPADPSTTQQMRASLAREFVRMDRDRSGFVEAAEVPIPNIDHRQEMVGKWLEQHDRNRDGKVTQAEFVDGTRYVFQLQALPTDEASN